MTSSMDGDIDLNNSGGWRRKKDLEKDTLKKQKKEERMRKKEEVKYCLLFIPDVLKCGAGTAYPSGATEFTSGF